MNIDCRGAINEKKQIIISVLIAPNLWWKGGGKRRQGLLPARVPAVVDTGANISCIPSVLVEKLDLSPWNMRLAQTPSGIKPRDNVYRVDMRVLSPRTEKLLGGVDHAEFSSVEVMEIFGNRMLLGMDIITQGELLVRRNDFILRL